MTIPVETNRICVHHEVTESVAIAEAHAFLGASSSRVVETVHLEDKPAQLLYDPSQAPGPSDNAGTLAAKSEKLNLRATQIARRDGHEIDVYGPALLLVGLAKLPST